MEEGKDAAPTASACLDAAENEAAKKIVRACEKHWEAGKSDCNKFLKLVARESGIVDLESAGNADAIIAYLDRSPAGWTTIPQSKHEQAHTHATAGKFVVAAMTSKDMNQDHGHVVVVTCGAMEPGGGTHYPRGYWGRLGAVGERCKSINWSFPEGRKTKLRYYSRSLP